MSEAAERKIAELEREVRAVQELFFGVLWEIGQPVTVDIDELREVLSRADHMIDSVIDTDSATVTVDIKEIVRGESV